MIKWVTRARAAAIANQTQGSNTYGLIFYRPYCDHATPEFSYLSDTYLVLGLEAAARALQAYSNSSLAQHVWQAAGDYRHDVEQSMRASVYRTPKGLRTVPVFPQTVELIKAANNTAKNYYSLTGANLLEADFFSSHDVSAELISNFIEKADGLVPGLVAARFDMPPAYSSTQAVKQTFYAPAGHVDIPPTVEPWFKLVSATRTNLCFLCWKTSHDDVGTRREWTTRIPSAYGTTDCARATLHLRLVVYTVASPSAPQQLLRA